MLGDEWGVGQVFWSFVWFTLFFIWIWLLITVFADIFRSPDLSGVAKFLWVAFVVIFPYLGVFVYFVAWVTRWPSTPHAKRRQSTPRTARTYAMLRPPRVQRTRSVDSRT